LGLVRLYRESDTAASNWEYNTQKTGSWILSIQAPSNAEQISRQNVSPIIPAQLLFLL
jgi:hypothetical protein